MRALSAVRPRPRFGWSGALRRAAVAATAAGFAVAAVAPSASATPRVPTIDEGCRDDPSLPGCPNDDDQKKRKSGYHRTKADIDQPISAKEAFVRSKDWIDRQVPYSQTGPPEPDIGNTNKYRRDCSGLVSMAWHLKQSHTTMSFPSVTERISWSQVAPGDALLKDGHIVLFVRWTKDGSAVIREHYSTPKPPREAVMSRAKLAMDGYHPIRYPKMQVVTPEVARKETSKVLPKIKVKMEPPDQETYTNFPTIFYSGAEPFHETVHMVDGSVPVEVWAEPIGFHWDFGDDHDEKGDDPGKPYPNQTVTHEYEKTGDYKPSVDVTWGNLRYQLPGDDEPREMPGELETLGQFTPIKVVDTESALTDR